LTGGAPATGGTPIADLSFASPSGAGFTLQQALEIMNRTHPQLQSVRAATRAAEHDVTAAGLWTNPQFNVTYTHSLTPSSAYDPLVGYVQAGVTQLIETANLPGARRTAAEHTLTATRSDGEAVRRGLMFDVYTAFVAVAAAAVRLQIYQQSATQLEQAANVVRQRVAAGATADYDLRRITLALADARAAVDDAQADLINARGLFDVAVGPSASTLQGLPQIDLLARTDPPALETLLETMYRERPELRALRARILAANAQIQVARRTVFQGIQLYVGLAFGANNQWAGCNGLTAGQAPYPWTVPGQMPMPGQAPFPTCGSQGSLGPEFDLSAAVTMPLPLIDRGQGTIPAAEARASNAQLTTDAFQLAAEQRVRSAYDEYQRRRQGLDRYLATGAAESATLLLSEAQASYREGRTNILDLVDAYNTVRDARLRLGSLAADLRTSEIGLWRAVGAMPNMPAPTPP
jgi:outer membrane protein TolC